MLFESGPRLPAALADLAAGLGPRAAAICRELTKLHEEIRRGDLARGWRSHYASGAETRGEIVIVVAPPADDAATVDDVDALLRSALARVSVKDAVGEVALATGRPRREVYQRALALADAADEEDDGDGAAVTQRAAAQAGMPRKPERVRKLPPSASAFPPRAAPPPG